MSAPEPYRNPGLLASGVRIAREREEEPLAQMLDFGVVYGLFLRPPAKGAARPRVVLKVSWDLAGGAETASCAFELDLPNSRLTALGRKGQAFPASRLCAGRLCRWASTVLLENRP